MKTLVWLVVGSVAILFVLTTFVPYPPSEAAAQRLFTEKEIENGLQFAFERRLFMWAHIALELAVLMPFALTGLARRCADRCLAWTGQRRLPAALVFGLFLAIAQEAFDLPLGIGRFYHAKAWGMANYGLGGWLYDHVVTWGVTLVTGSVVIAGLYALLTALPRWWWIVAPVGSGLLSVGFVFLMPIVIAPLFNDFTPLTETPWRDQEPRMRSLIGRAGISVGEILVMNASRQGNHTNAYFTGFGPTRRIVLYDTLLKQHTPDEIESILAHEIGHWQHDHIVKGLLIGAFASLIGCFLLDRILRLAMTRPPWRLASRADPAGLPLILLCVYLGAWIVEPVGNAIGRHFERQADQTSLDLAKHPAAFIECEKKLARDNYLNVAPTPWNVWLFSTHPPTLERIRMAEDWRQRHQ